MSLPTYDKSKRKRAFEQLPKGAYVVKIVGAKQEKNKNNDGQHITIAFDIAEGEYKGYWDQRFQSMKANNDDAKWPNDAIYYLTVPADGSPQYVHDNWNTFFADLEDSNNGFVFDGDVKKLKGKLIGGKFHIEQTEYNSRVYNHTKLRWTCIADDVRNGTAEKNMPQDKLLSSASSQASSAPAPGSDDFMNIPDGTDEELPF